VWRDTVMFLCEFTNWEGIIAVLSRLLKCKNEYDHTIWVWMFFVQMDCWQEDHYTFQIFLLSYQPVCHILIPDIKSTFMHAAIWCYKEVITVLAMKHDWNTEDLEHKQSSLEVGNMPESECCRCEDCFQMTESKWKT